MLARFTFIVSHLSFIILLSSCGTFYEDHGSAGQPCFGDGSCDGSLVCCDGTCRDSCGADGDTDFSTSDGDEETADGDVSTDGDQTTDGDDDTIADGDQPTDGDDDPIVDGDEESDPECECAMVDDCCDGCHWTTASCTPDDENALGGTCAEGVCLIDACKGSWHVSLDRLSCEEDAADGDEETESDGDLDDDPDNPVDGDDEQTDGDVPADGDDELPPDGDEEIEPDGDLEIVDGDPDEESDEDVEEIESDIEAGSLSVHGAPIRPSATGADAFRTVQMKLRWCPGVWIKE